MTQRAPFATRPDQSRGRLHAEPASATRTPFQRDRDRIIHCAAFRRLQYKTQVFVCHEGENFRTRLTHSLEVAQIARAVSRQLGLDEDLAEALALAHDLGHTPFGHAGEEALDEKLRPVGGFDHNAQSLRIVTRLERRYLAFDGLNLTWETLEGLVKHNGPLTGPAAVRRNGPLPRAIAEYAELHDLALDSHAGPEAQVAALSDDIAYNNHDIEDGLRAGLFSIGDLAGVPLVGPLFAEVAAAYPGAEASQRINEVVRRMIGLMITDLVAETRRRIARFRPGSAAEVRGLGQPLVAFSDGMRANDAGLRDFLHPHMYHHYTVNRMTSKGRRVVRDLFDLLVIEPNCLPPDWYRLTDGSGTPRTARMVGDYIAGLSDRAALEEHRKLFDPQEKS